MSLDEFTDNLERVNALRAEVQHYKKKAGEFSADLLRAQKAIGERDNRIAEMAGLQAELDQLKAANAALASHVRAAEQDLADFNTQAEKNKEQVASARRFAAVLKGLAIPE